jgi:hypothetical protein
MQGAIFLWSTVEFLYQRKRKGLLLNLEFYHACDRVCLPYVDKVLEVVALGLFPGMVETLHKSRAIPISFSVRQEDPLALFIFNI